jgi:redox-sensitive bicupin YhaK (pirin superfamily)
MITLVPADSRGHANHGWLNSFHTFSFADYYDESRMGFRSLRVINEDWVAAGTGFGMHPHRDMEIVTYVLSGGLTHKDSMGNGSTIRPGMMQRMSAGTGVRHSEHNHSQSETVHLYQIWLLPDVRSIPPEYEERQFDEAKRHGGLQLLASKDGRDGSMKVHQDVSLYSTVLEPGKSVLLPVAAGRGVWIQTARGKVAVSAPGSAADGRHELGAGDAAAIEEVREVRLEGLAGDEAAEVLIFDLA